LIIKKQMMKKEYKNLKEILKEKYGTEKIKKDLLKQGFSKKDIEKAINSTLSIISNAYKKLEKNKKTK